MLRNVQGQSAVSEAASPLATYDAGAWGCGAYFSGVRCPSEVAGYRMVRLNRVHYGKNEIPDFECQPISHSRVLVDQVLGEVLPADGRITHRVRSIAPHPRKNFCIFMSLNEKHFFRKKIIYNSIKIFTLSPAKTFSQAQGSGSKGER